MNSSVRQGDAVARKSAAKVSNEDRLIARHFKPLATTPGAFGLTDDAAAFRPPPGHELVVTVDAIVGGVHFYPNDPPDAVARKALRVNLSDLAAKGATPAGFLLTLALPKGVSGRWLETFAWALGSDARRYGCPLFGGDTVYTPGPLMASVMAFGVVPSRGMVRRAGARVGDHIFVSGTIGDAALGLMLRGAPKRAARWKLSAAQRRYLTDRYHVPQPRNALALAVRKYASAAMDVSDGLAGDLAKLCRVSGVAAAVEAARVPFSGAARAVLKSDAALVSKMLSGGDDYEIVCTVRPAKLKAFQSAARAAGVPVTDIGRIVRGSGTVFRRPDGSILTFERASFSHF
jgi:thiamine-monophosphate kinase